MTDRLTDQQKHDLLERAKELAVTIHEDMEWPLDNAVQGAIDDTTDDRSVHSTVNSTKESRTAVDSFLSDNESKIREHVKRNSDGEFITRTASALTQTQRNHLTDRVAEGNDSAKRKRRSRMRKRLVACFEDLALLEEEASEDIVEHIGENVDTETMCEALTFCRRIDDAQRQRIEQESEDWEDVADELEERVSQLENSLGFLREALMEE